MATEERSGKGKQIREGYGYDMKAYVGATPPSEWLTQRERVPLEPDSDLISYRERGWWPFNKPPSGRPGERESRSASLTGIVTTIAVSFTCGVALGLLMGQLR